MKCHCQNFGMFHTSINLPISPQEGNIFADMSLLTYPFAGRHSYFSGSLHSHPNPFTGHSITCSSPGLLSYSKPPITHPAISQNSITYVPPFLTLDISSYCAKPEHCMHSEHISVFPTVSRKLCFFTCSRHDHSNERWNIISRTQKNT